MRAARAAGRIHLSWLNRTKTTRKSNALDLVTEADKEAEAAIIETHPSRVSRPMRSSPRKAAPASISSEHRWIIDPLDGTTNFAHGFPAFCVSIAYEHRGRVQFGVVFDALHKDLFIARRGKGAKLNGKPIRVSKATTLATSLLATGFAYDRRERRRFYLCFWEADDDARRGSAARRLSGARSRLRRMRAGSTASGNSALSRGTLRRDRCWWRRLAAR